MKALFISNQCLFPPRCGVTVPAAAYAQGVAELSEQVDFLLLERGNEKVEEGSNNSQYFSSIFICRIKRMSLVRGVLLQLLGIIPYFAAWSLVAKREKKTVEPYDLIWVTPRAGLVAAADWRERTQAGQGCLVAAVNDIATLRLKRMSESSLPTNSFFAKICNRVKAFNLARSEARLLMRADRIVVQTKEEMVWLKKNAPNLVERSIVLPNGVDAPFFEISMERTSPTVVFVGALTGMYAERVAWFLDEVWPEVHRKAPHARLRVVGRCDNQELIDKIKLLGGAYEAFVEDPKELYREQAILIAPIFKGYGLINKVLQAMAAGTLVVGDKTAFNGIPYFENNRHGLVANTKIEFIESIVRAINEPTYLKQIRVNARTHMIKHFSWKDRIEKVHALTDGII